MPSERKHLQHIKTEMKQYTPIGFNNIPSDQGITAVNSLPTPQEIANQANPSRYIRVPRGNTLEYYELNGKQPQDLKLGELAVSYSRGYERLFMKNSAREIIEFRPYKPNPNELRLCTMHNEEDLKTDGGYCNWTVKYLDLQTNGVNPSYPSIAVLRQSDGLQRTDAEIVFNDEDVQIEIAIPSDVDILMGDITLIIIGFPFN